MIRLLLLCLFLLGCYSAHTDYMYGEFPIDDESRADLDDDFARYLKYYSELDSSLDGYYLVYSRNWDAVDVGSEFLFFFDNSDSITLCPFRLRCQKHGFKNGDFPTEDLERARPLFPQGSGDVASRIYGYRKESGKKRYYKFYQMDACHGDSACAEKWKNSIQENAEQYELNDRLLKSFEQIVSTLYEGK